MGNRCGRGRVRRAVCSRESAWKCRAVDYSQQESRTCRLSSTTIVGLGSRPVRSRIWPRMRRRSTAPTWGSYAFFDHTTRTPAASPGARTVDSPGDVRLLVRSRGERTSPRGTRALGGFPTGRARGTRRHHEGRLYYKVGWESSDVARAPISSATGRWTSAANLDSTAHWLGTDASTTSTTYLPPPRPPSLLRPPQRRISLQPPPRPLCPGPVFADVPRAAPITRRSLRLAA